MFRITAPHFVAGGEYDSDLHVFDTAPIISYMRKWVDWKVKKYCEKKKWKYEEL